MSSAITIREEALRYYFYFVQERMRIFWEQNIGNKISLSNDPILNTYKFTNVYRATDRVSQYLIKDVIYQDRNVEFDEVDILLRIILFKIFNKPETWIFLESKLGPLCRTSFNLRLINMLLEERRISHPIFNNAYMMTGTHSKYNYLTFKHEKWLQMVNDELLAGKILYKVAKASSLEEAYLLLINCSFIGEFLAYQYIIDFNYSEVLSFDENSFVKAGIGAIRGIKKCFKSLGGRSFEEAIRYTFENFNYLQKRFGYTSFINLYGRQPTLIDLQNCFCETDKYLRVKLPSLNMGNTRIKQKYKPHPRPIELSFPPKWNLTICNEENHMRNKKLELIPC